MRYRTIPFLLVFSTALLGCGGSSECADSAATQSSGAAVVEAKCTVCHSSQLQGAARAGAPDGYDFDDPAIVAGKADEMSSAVSEGRMPKTGTLSADEKESMMLYLECAGP